MDLDTALATLAAASAAVVAALREVDLTGASRDQLVTVVESTQRVSNTMGGVQTVAVAHLAAIEDHADQHGEWSEQHRGLGHCSLDAASLIAPPMGITVQAASTRVELAVHQLSVTPALVTAMLAGDVDPWRARVVTGEVEICPDEGAAKIVDDLVDHYAQRGRGWHETAGPLRSRVRRMVARAHPDVVADEAEAAREGRMVRRRPSTMGTDHWEAELPVEVSLPMWQAVESLAQQLRSADPELTVDQARADALAQLVLQQASITVHLHGTVPEEAGAAGAGPDAASSVPTAHTAERASHATPCPATPSATAEPAARASASAAADPATGAPATRTSASAAAAPVARASRQLTEVGGLGAATPTLLDLDRLAAAHGVVVVRSTPLSCDPGTGAVVGGVVPASLARLVRKDAARHSDGYVVPADMARLVRLRDGRCRFPNCVVSASRTDQDHVIPWPVGATTPTNLMCLCRRHHRVKQRRGWRVRLDLDGVVHWTDPTGRPRTTYPIDHLDRVIVPTREKSQEPNEARGRADRSGGVALSGDGADRTFAEIVRTHLSELQTVPSALDERLWRALQLDSSRFTAAGRGDLNLGQPPEAITWWHPPDQIVLELAGCGSSRDAPPGDDPPF